MPCSRVQYVVCETKDCPDGKVYSPSLGGQCVDDYQFFTTDTTGNFDTVKARCEAQGGKIATILTRSEFDEAHTICKNKVDASGSEGCYIGLSDSDAEGRWKYDDDNTPRVGFYDNRDSAGRVSPRRGINPWWSGEPNNHGGNEDCIHIWQPQQFYWNDIGCTATQYGLCQRSYVL